MGIAKLCCGIASLVSALTRWLEDQRCRRERLRTQAQAKAEQILLDNLTREQLEQYLDCGYFEVIGSRTGKRYRIYQGTSRNVIELTEKGCPGLGYCFGPRGSLAAGDCMLAQKIALEHCEEEAMRAAFKYF